jgi:hypothetical protein
MANLLPDKTKKELRRDFWWRKFVVGGISLSLFLTIVIILFASIWAGLFIRERGLAKVSTTSNKESGETMSGEDSISLIKKVKDNSEIINQYWSEPLLSIMIERVLASKPKDIKVSGLSLLRSGKEVPIKISLTGLTNGRQTLVDYVNLLRQEKFFTRVDLPVESLISDEGGQFVINLEK